MCANLINFTITDGSDKRDNIYIVLVTMWRFSLVSIQFIRTSNPLFIRSSSFGGSAAYSRPRSSPQSHAPIHTSLFIRIRLDNGLEIFQVTFPHSTYTSTNDGVALITGTWLMVGDRQPMMDDGGGASGQLQINEEKNTHRTCCCSGVCTSRCRTVDGRDDAWAPGTFYESLSRTRSNRDALSGRTAGLEWQQTGWF